MIQIKVTDSTRWKVMGAELSALAGFVLSQISERSSITTSDILARCVFECTVFLPPVFAITFPSNH